MTPYEYAQIENARMRERMDGCPWGDKTIVTGRPKIIVPVNEREATVFALIKAKPGRTAAVLRAEAGLSVNQWKRAITNLKGTGHVVPRRQPDNSTTWWPK